MRTKEYNRAVNEYSNGLYRFILKSLRKEDEAHDIVQDAFMKLWEHRDNVDPAKIKPWLYRTAYNRMINLIKRNSRSQPMDSLEFFEPATENKSLEQKEIIDLALEQLPEQQRTIILLRDLEGYNYKEIGEMMALTDSQVKVYLFRGRQKIKNMLKSVNVLA